MDEELWNANYPVVGGLWTPAAASAVSSPTITLSASANSTTYSASDLLAK